MRYLLTRSVVVLLILVICGLLHRGNAQHGPAAAGSTEVVLAFNGHATGDIDKASATDEQIKVYPKRMKEFLYIEVPDYHNTTMELYNTSGYLLGSVTLDALKTTVETTNLASGAYLVKIKTPGAEILRKVVKD